MERDFEKEFRQLKQNEVPGLWNRIEAALPEKKIAAIPLEENKPIPVERYVPKKRMSWRNLGIIIAACLCVVILLPVMLIRLSGSASGGADTSAADESGAAQWENSSPAAGEATEDAASADTEIAEGVAGAETSTEAAAGESAAEGADGEMSGEDAGAEEMEGGNADNGEMSGQSVPDLEDGQVLEDVVVEILHVDLSGDEILYEALVVQEDSSRLLEAGMEISIFCNAESVYGFPLEPREKAVLKTGEHYIVTLCYQDLTFLVVEADLEKER